jgi:hypothetical protein
MDRLDREIAKVKADTTKAQSVYSPDYVQMSLSLDDCDFSNADNRSPKQETVDISSLVDDKDELYLPVSEATVFEKTALEVAKLVGEKQLAYGDSFGKSGEVLKLFYPNGIPVDQYTNALAITRVVDKLFRIATDKDAFGESPWRDINGYSLLALINDNRNKENAQ